jgi:hypothetical protein
MSNQNYSITISKNAEELSGLGDRVHAKHIADGVGSILAPLNMADLLLKNTAAKNFNLVAGQLNRDKELAFEARNLVLGIDNNNPDTVNYYVKSVRDILLGIHKGKERNLGSWGFNVQGENPDISVEIPLDEPGLIRLADLIIAKHVADGPASVLSGLNMADFTAKNATATTQHALGQKLNRDKEKAFKERDHALGIADGQTTKTPGTVKFYMTSARDVLVGFNKQKEYNLGDWGYDVQFSAGPGSPTGTFKVIPSSIIVGGTSMLEWNISGAATVEIDNGIGIVGDNGTQPVTPAVTTIYKLTATAANGKKLIVTRTVTVI